MELKYYTSVCDMCVVVLLIVPYGIEIQLSERVFFLSTLLIVPYGIEMQENDMGILAAHALLIVPYGIEMMQPDLCNAPYTIF